MKFKLLPLFLLVTLLTIGQNEKGDWNISISASPYPTQTDGQDDFGFLGLAGMEFFVSEKVSLGGSFFTSDNSALQNDSNVTIKSYGFVPSLQYYFINKAKWNVYGHAGYGFGLDDDSRGGTNGNALRVYSVGPGAHYILNDKLNVKFFFPYFNTRNKTLAVNAADGIAVFLGIVFKL
ncbi:outer membrane beta-barrel protein [Patiriisocius sp. Uisw_017]|jgi:hypothetical protein|uniref:outer membrane beta-barrel protein n=1 Tax=Patiriisocius sp. Uisw_017 TaxID=3230968 RepID=UPI0039E9D75C